MAKTRDEAEPSERAVRAAEEIFRHTDNVRAAAQIIDRAIAEALGGRKARHATKTVATESGCGCRWHRAVAAARAGAGR